MSSSYSLRADVPSWKWVVPKVTPLRKISPLRILSPLNSHGFSIQVTGNPHKNPSTMGIGTVIPCSFKLISLHSTCSPSSSLLIALLDSDFKSWFLLFFWLLDFGHLSVCCFCCCFAKNILNWKLIPSLVKTSKFSHLFHVLKLWIRSSLISSHLSAGRLGWLVFLFLVP